MALLVAGLLLSAAAVWGDKARRRAPLAWHAYVPWNALVFLGITAALFSAVHLYTMAQLPG